MTEHQAKRQAKLRDGGRCRMCQRGGVWSLHVHHVRPKALFPELGSELGNLITLCLHCHLGIVHGGRISDGGNPEGRWRKWVFWCLWIIRQKP